MAEKILAKPSKRDTVRPDEFVTREVAEVMEHDRSLWAGHMLMTRNRLDRVRYPDRIVVVIDHAVPVLNVRAATVPSVLALRGVGDIFEEGNQLELDFENSLVKNLTIARRPKAPFHLLI